MLIAESILRAVNSELSPTSLLSRTLSRMSSSICGQREQTHVQSHPSPSLEIRFNLYGALISLARYATDRLASLFLIPSSPSPLSHLARTGILHLSRYPLLHSARSKLQSLGRSRVFLSMRCIRSRDERIYAHTHMRIKKICTYVHAHNKPARVSELKIPY